MAKFLVKASYNSDGIKGVLKDGGSGRVGAVAKMATDLGGHLDAFYFALGDTDIYAIVDVPDTVTATAVAATIGAAGAMSKYETVVLLTPEEVDSATKIAVNYRPPGQ